MLRMIASVDPGTTFHHTHTRGVAIISKHTQLIADAEFTLAIFAPQLKRTFLGDLKATIASLIAQREFHSLFVLLPRLGVHFSPVHIAFC